MVVFVPETWVVIKEVMVNVPVVADFSQLSNSFCIGLCEGITTKTIKIKIESTMAKTTSAILTFRLMGGQKMDEVPRIHFFVRADLSRLPNRFPLGRPEPPAGCLALMPSPEVKPSKSLLELEQLLVSASSRAVVSRHQTEDIRARLN
jgi:hypothetical protein